MNAQTFARFTPGKPAPAAAVELRDALMSARDLAADLDAAGAVAAARDLYWLALAVAAQLVRDAAAQARELARFAPLAVAELLDALCLAHDYAASVVPGGPWLRALDAAWGYLLQQDTIWYDAERHALRVESATTAGKFYTANGACGCTAFTRGEGICWHRAAARLVARALELQRRAAALIAAGDAAPERALAYASADMGFPIYNRPAALAA